MMPDGRVAEALGRLMGIPVDRLTGDILPPLAVWRSADSLDTIESIMEHEEEVGERFDEDTMRWAMCYIEAIAAHPDDDHRSKRGPGPEAPDQLWDRDLDG
jgi:hypothetical protein